MTEFLTGLGMVALILGGIGLVVGTFAFFVSWGDLKNDVSFLRERVKRLEDVRPIKFKRYSGTEDEAAQDEPKPRPRAGRKPNARRGQSE